MKSNTTNTLLVIGGLGLLAYLFWKNTAGAGGLLPGGGTSAAGAAPPGNTGFTNPTLAPIGITAAQAAGGTALSANVGGTNPFTITGMTWG